MYQLTSLDKTAVAEALERKDLPEDVRRVLELRQQTSKTSNKKFDVMVSTRCKDDRIRGTLQFYGANRSGRYCLAEGTLVCTKDGWRPIESIRPMDVVFDGTEFVVCQGGAIPKGVKHCINLDGVWCTPDHKFLRPDDNPRSNNWHTAKELQRPLAFDAPPDKEYRLVYDLMNCGNRHRYVVQSKSGFFIAKNCGRFIQPQNFPRSYVKDLDLTKQLIIDNDYNSLRLIYGNVPDTLSQMLRCAMIPSPGNLFIDCDFSAIEARVLAWMAGEEWVLDVFRTTGKIYEATYAQAFGVPLERVKKHSPERQQGKVMQLACIAEGELVLTDHGEKPIEQVTIKDKVWDGKVFTSHGGLVYNGVREVIEYDGLRATPDHLVFVEGNERPVPFAIAAESGARLLSCRTDEISIWACGNHIGNTPIQQNMEHGLCSRQVHWLRNNKMVQLIKSVTWNIQGLSKMQSKTSCPRLAIQTIDRSKRSMPEPRRPGIFSLWSKRNNLLLEQCERCLPLGNGQSRSEQNSATRQDKQQSWLRTGEHSICYRKAERSESRECLFGSVRSTILALCREYRTPQTRPRKDERSNHSGSKRSRNTTQKGMALHREKVRVYDIRNAGPYHRYTVSGKIVHNCGYGGSEGAMARMDFNHEIDPSLYKGLVEKWRSSNPNIVKFWYQIGDAVMDVVKHGGRKQVRMFEIALEGDAKKSLSFLTIRLPSGRKLFYVNPGLCTNRFGNESVCYMGSNQITRKWEQIESYGPKFVENATQAIARDLLCEKIVALEQAGLPVVFSIHDEIVCDVPKDKASLDKMVEIMSAPVSWAEGLPLAADGWVDDKFKKD